MFSADAMHHFKKEIFGFVVHYPVNGSCLLKIKHVNNRS